MNRQQREHILRAAAAITGAHELVVIGSQSILGKHPQSPHDLAISKLVAGREKDLAFIAAMIVHRLADPSVLQQRLDATSLTNALRDACEARLKQALAKGA